MRLKQYNKATAAMLAGAATAALGAVLAVDGETLSAMQTLLTVLFVWLVPNGA